MNTDRRVKVALRDDDGEVETLWATPLGAGRYRLENSPFFTYRVSWLDVVEAAPAPDGQLEAQRVVEKSGHRTVRVILDDVTAPESKPFREAFLRLGCTYEGFQPKLLSIDVPPTASLSQVADFLTAEGVEWEYADPKYEDLFPDDT
ncbi:DUF4265 domain-containing protein [Myxococcus stipitatus]|uniref:DUF4265 domain-containing protein n=1 Tax=Myxococcus stipitatus TaxID=83455 RepID=UPI0031450D01